ncbi:uncharacterized protein RSE6_13812 [Rhynchosporium secalis]|uniref:Centrosomin N-terminal motif 1 domain-containing protein n=1 Tax=Rhynchosporium secalis TaxID=38038 RepID=A0A1E1MTS2_RHYSE|nr:uncharacterized protein RSE6_13812 [Rhynchosporium secalis]
MEESLGSRRARGLPRPDSSTSSHNTRMTPSSSNSSTAHLPQRVQDLTARGASGSLLQDRLRERKVESARQRRRSIDPAVERGVQSSPVKGSRDDRRPSSSGIVAGKNMGVKQIEDAVSTLHKQNFDLKLELFHRRQRQETLEARLEAAERKLEEQAELAEINDDLLAELEKRDQAVEEAVGIIVQLEEKVDRLIQEREDVKAFDAGYEPGYFPPHDNDFSSSPPQFEKEAQSLPMHKKISRMPSFLSETTEGNEALRSLYLPHNGHSDSTLPKLPEEGFQDGMDSPRLSLLSESSFISVYGAKLQPPSRDLDESEEPRRHRKSSSIEKWVDDRPSANTVVTPQKVIPSLRKSQFLSINDVLESPLQRLEKLKHTLEKTEKGLNSARDAAIKDRRKSREVRPAHTDKKSFHRQHQHTLPPTPDTISTNTLRNFRSSTETLSQNHMNTTFLNSTSTFPDTAHHAFQSQLSIRPRSAGETVTSRREGHGWDTPGDDTTTDAGSVDSTLSTTTFDAQFSHDGRERVVAPDLFTFSGGDWGRGYEPSFPAHTTTSRSRYDALRRSSVIDDHPRSDDTVTNYSSHYNTYDDDSSPPLQHPNQDYEYGISPISTTPKPDLPDRRSSLSAVMKLRKSNTNSTASQAPITQASDSPGSATREKKSRIPNLRLFGRGDSAPPPSSPTKIPVSHALQRPRAGPTRSSGYFVDAHTGAYQGEEEEGARATPPPIMRQRGGRERPVSVVGVGGMVRRGSSFVDAQEQERVEYEIGNGRARQGSVNAVMSGNLSAEMGTRDEEASKAKKWFGLQVGRAGSVRRN